MTDQQPGDLLDEAAKLLDAVRRRVGDAARAAASGPRPSLDDDEDVWARATADAHAHEDARADEGARTRDDVWARATTDARARVDEDPRVREGARTRDDVWARAAEEARASEHAPGSGRAEASRGDARERGKADGEDVWAHVLAEDPHIATGALECRNCPVCRAIALARESGPDVRRHVEQAGRSLLAAVSDVVAAYGRTRSGRSGRDAADVG
ncbi:hypothetical protein [Actinomadura oligospora]|uniref:hypothetical protein n=1 Tax=Actinomadura oligospora TaxID=111804 RepID=UPI00047C300E|nr:hypothetical protein [Actinomadura oligospora]